MVELKINFKNLMTDHPLCYAYFKTWFHFCCIFKWNSSIILIDAIAIKRGEGTKIFVFANHCLVEQLGLDIYPIKIGIFDFFDNFLVLDPRSPTYQPRLPPFPVRWPPGDTEASPLENIHLRMAKFPKIWKFFGNYFFGQ